jgi:hypothetical protein
MLRPAKIDLRADRRVPFVRIFAFVDFDFTGASFKMEIRDYPDASGSARITLNTVSSEVQGVRLLYGASDTVQDHILAGRLTAIPPGLQLTTPVFVSQVKVRIDKANVTALPEPAELGDDIDLAYDLHITPSGGDEDVYASGLFTVVAGVTT